MEEQPDKEFLEELYATKLEESKNWGTDILETLDYMHSITTPGVNEIMINPDSGLIGFSAYLETSEGVFRYSYDSIFLLQQLGKIIDCSHEDTNRTFEILPGRAMTYDVRPNGITVFRVFESIGKGPINRMDISTFIWADSSRIGESEIKNYSDLTKNSTEDNNKHNYT